MKKRANKNKATEAEILSQLEKLMERDFQKEIDAAKTAKSKIRKLARYYLKKGNVKKYEAKLRSCVHFESKIDEINLAYGKTEKRKTRNEERLKNPFENFFADFDYTNRKQINDYVFKNAELKTYKGKSIKKQLTEILKKIDNLLAKMTYKEILIIESTGANINDIYLVDLETFANA